MRVSSVYFGRVPYTRGDVRVTSRGSSWDPRHDLVRASLDERPALRGRT